MTVINIRELNTTETGFAAELSFDGHTRIPIKIDDPFNAKEERRLEWYFEGWLQHPMLETHKAEAAANSVKTYGEKLFEQVFNNRQAIREYEKIKSKLSQVQIEIENRNPEFQALHWEAIKDPELPRPLAVDCIMLRKYCELAPISAAVESFPYINVLVVVARPDEDKDVSYRTISRPLIEVIETSHLPVNVELLRPGTYQALSKHLEEKGAGYYHILHFDGHGALMDYQQVQQPNKPQRYYYKGRYGRSDIEEFEGVKAFLCFEQEEAGKVDLVEATEFANLLTGKSIPVCLLNACQSGKQIDNVEDYRETSLGSRLMAAGMQMVVAMGYSVTVSAAQKMMQQLYQHLLTGKEITEAIRLGRLELYNDKERQAYFNQTIELEDWLLPVVYFNQTVNFNLRPFTPEEEEKYWEKQGSQYHFSLPEYGFVGRDLEILKIEKALLRHNILLLRGMGGTGKTTLLNYLREWWQTTHFAENVFYFGYDIKAYTVNQILHEIGQQVYDRFEQAKFQAMNPNAQMPKLVQKLKTESHILILDNLESVTGQELAIQNTLSADEQQKLKDFLNRLVGGKTRIVLGSRSGEDWLRNDTFRTNLYPLQGLDTQARSLLAERILNRHAAGKVEVIKADDNFKRLIKLLAGYPLAMEVVLANLKRQSPSEILTALQAADINLDEDSEDKTKSILKCVEYSHSNLSPTAQKLLLCLAPFSGFIVRSAIPEYVKQLKELEPFQDYEFDQFDDAIQEAINWGLLSVRFEENPHLLNIQPVFPYFLKTKLNALNAATYKVLQKGFKRHYQGLAGDYQQLMKSKEADKRQIGIFLCRLEYENLYNALEISLQQQDSVSIVYCLSIYLDLTEDVQTHLKLLEWVIEAQTAYPDEMRTGEIGLDLIQILGLLATCYLKNQNYRKAKQFYNKVIDLTQLLEGVSEEQKQFTIACTYHYLGRIAFEQRQWQHSQRYCKDALNIFIKYDNQSQQASIHHTLGRVAEEQRQWQTAQTYYQKALDIYIKYSDRLSQAFNYYHLGRVAEEQRHWQAAQTYYQKSLDIKIEYGDRHSQASSYHQLGMLAQQQRQWQDAKTYYQQALDIKIEYGDRPSQALTYNNLGMLAQQQQQWQIAKTYYQQAIDIYIEYGDRYSQALTCHNLGMVAQAQRQWQDAKTYYQQALNIKIEYGDRYSQAYTYHQLGRVAEEQRQWQIAQTYYQQALDIYIEYSDRHSQAFTYGQLGLLAEAQEDWETAKTNSLQALEIFAEFEDQHYLDMTLRNLARLYHTTEDESLLTSVASIFGVEVEEVQRRFEELRE
ncbi:MAG: tetratricopeptide repeat protein [Microcoleaceae cyanobacterium]